MYKGPATRGQEQKYKTARAKESTRIMTRGIPEKPFLEEKNIAPVHRDRLSQCFDYSKLSALREKILSPLTDRLEYFASGSGFNIQVIIDDDKGELNNIGDKVYVGNTFTEEFGRKPEKPLVLHCALEHHKNKEMVSGHALLLIYFPTSRELDIVSTYPMDIEEREAIKFIVGAIVAKRMDITVNDTMEFVGRIGYDNLQKLETDSVGFCVTWMAFMTYILSKNPKTFWELPYGNPRQLEQPEEATRLYYYRLMYNSIMANDVIGPTALKILGVVIRSGGSRKLRRAQRKSRKTRRNQRNRV